MKKIILCSFVLLSLLTSCVTTKKTIYFENKDEINTALSKTLYDAKIMPKDILKIQVFSMTPGIVEPFNLLKSTQASSTMNSSSTNQGATVYDYLVDNEGNVDMPIIGTVHLGGLTKNEAEQLIKSKIVPYLSETEKPIVHVRIANYKYAVLGGVNKPGVFTTQNEKVSILEAIAQAGDLTTFARRDHIFLVRENAEGQKDYHQLDINDANIISSPYYYLQQNDVIYVEQQKIAANTSILLTITSALTSVATLILALTK